ncbi:MAG TPA: hypothetical protein VFA74_15600 [Terriglobales bacterium]|nr:hypothetical protein [Terriglobales bacterium]
MSISAISSNAQTQNNLLQILLQQSKTQFQKLAQDLQSGNLTGAQQDFTQLSAAPKSTNGIESNSSNAGLPAGTTLQINQDLSTLGSDLQSGNLSGAQQAYASLQQDLNASASAGQVHHHHHQSSGPPSSTSTSNTSNFSLSSILSNIGAIPLAGLNLTV